MLPNITDLTIKTKLASGLCYQFSAKNIPHVEKVIADGYDSGQKYKRCCGE